MLEVVSHIMICLTTYILNSYFFAKLSHEKIKFNFIITVLACSITIFVYYSETLTDGIVKLITTNICTFILLKITYNKETSKTLLATLFISISYILAEAIFALVFLVILNLSPNFFIDTLFGTWIFNLFEFLLLIGLFQIKIIQKFLFKIISWNENNRVFNLIVSIILAMLICYIFLYFITFD